MEARCLVLSVEDAMSVISDLANGICKLILHDINVIREQLDNRDGSCGVADVTAIFLLSQMSFEVGLWYQIMNNSLEKRLR